MRRLVTWAVVGFVTALAVAVVVTAVSHGGDDGASTVPDKASVAATVPLPLP